jgi:ankyrin repeat protein
LLTVARAHLLRCSRAQLGATPLHAASAAGHLAVARLLLERGAAREAIDSVRADAGRNNTV